MIEVFVRSIVMPSKLAEFKDSYDLHYFFERNLRASYDWLREQGFSKGRMMEPGSAALLQVLDTLAGQLAGDVAIHDVATLRGSARAFLAGIRRVPAAVIDGKRHAGLQAATAALEQLMDPAPR